MAEPTWPAGIFAAITLAIALYCAIRLIAVRVQHRATAHDIDIVHVLMGTAMAGMFVPALSFLSNGMWALVFVTSAAWFAVCSGRAIIGQGARAGIGHHAAHFAESCTMLFMLIGVPSSTATDAMSGSSSMGSMSGGSSGTAVSPFLAAAFALILLAYAAVVALRIHPVGVTSTPVCRHSATDTTQGSGSSVRDAPFLGRSAVLGRHKKRSPTTPRSAQCPMLAPRAAACCQIGMCLSMSYMLITMV
ncbi:DUF5134 domain-containing protein [Streptomyces sp. NPDC096354]|uniref:DUF5134 domain-containing protein n=1 Tax=Streptomyces sp. NPDC096354 TaxID=3366088 RepID=UPI0038278349